MPRKHDATMDKAIAFKEIVMLEWRIDYPEAFDELPVEVVERLEQIICNAYYDEFHPKSSKPEGWK